MIMSDRESNEVDHVHSNVESTNNETEWVGGNGVTTMGNGEKQRINIMSIGHSGRQRLETNILCLRGNYGTI